MYIGFAAIGVFAILLWSFLSGREPAMITAMIPAQNGAGIQAFREVAPGDLQEIQIPADPALESKIVTKQWYEAVTTGANWDAYVKTTPATPGPLFTVTNLLPGQIIDRMALQQNPSASYQIVLPDERVIGVTTDLSGAMAGTLKAGDVVNAFAESTSGIDGTNDALFAKVISIGVGANAGKGVAGTTAPIAAGDGNAGIQVLLAVAKNDAPGLAGKNVRMVLNPFCAVVGAEPAAGSAQETQPDKDKAIGQIVPVAGRESGCQVPSARAANSGTSG